MWLSKRPLFAVGWPRQIDEGPSGEPRDQGLTTEGRPRVSSKRETRVDHRTSIIVTGE